VAWSRKAWPLRWKLVAGAVLIEAVMLAALVLNNVRLIENSLHEQVDLRLAELSVLLNAAIAPSMAQLDYGPIQGVFAQSRRGDGVTYFALFDKSGKWVAGDGWPAGQPLPEVQAHPAVGSETRRFDVEIPITIDNQIYGRLQFGLSTDFLHAARTKLVRESIAIAVIEIALSLVLLALLGTWLMRHLAKLEAASLAVGQGRFDVEVNIQGADEIARVGQAFNRMTGEIKVRLADLGKSEARFRTLIERAPDAIVVVDVDAQRIVDANPRAESLFECPRQELLGSAVDRFYVAGPPEAEGAVMESIRDVQRRAFAGESVVVERPLRAARGREFLAEVRVDDLSDGKRRLIRASYTDITERKRAEESLRESEQFLRDIFNNAAEGIWVIDTDRRTLRANRALCAMLAVSETDIRGRSIYSFVDDRNAQIFRERSAITQESGSGTSYEVELTNSLGNKLTCLFNSSPLRDAGSRIIGSFAVVNDITVRKATEDELRKTKERYDLAAAIGKVGTWDWNPATGALAWNDETFRLLGFEPGAVAPGYALFLAQVHPGDRERLDREVKAALYEKAPYALECRIVKHGGAEIACHVTGMVEFAADGHATRMLGTIQDITERKRTELEAAAQRTFRETLVESIPGVFYAIDTGGRFLLFNNNLLAVTQRTAAELMATNAAALFDEDERPQIVAAIARSFAEGGAEAEGSLVGLHGSRTPFYFTGRRIEFEGRPILVGTGIDISERKQAEARLQLAASVFSQAREGIVITDTGGVIVDVNETFCHITGYSREDAVGQTPRILKSGRQSEEFYAEMWRSLTDKGHWYGEMWNRKKNGELYAELINITVVRDARGVARNYVALFTDITAMKEHQQQLEHIAHYDALTGLPNRVLLADRLHQAIAQARRRETLMAVVYLDLDGFKEVNDSHGHETGDGLLIALSQRMKEALREGDTLARPGGDEFVIVLADLATVAECEIVLIRLLHAAAAPAQIGDRVLKVSASLGVTLFPIDDGDADSLLRHADQAMYQAKQAGKNRYHLFDVDQDAAVSIRRESLDHIRRALDRREFVLYYQPKVNMRTGTVVGAEALIRWQHPARGLLPPADFLPVIEDHPIGVELGEWVIETVLLQIRDWNAAGLGIPVSVNVGARQLQQGDFAARLSQMLAARPEVRPGQLELEILETSALEDVAQVSERMHACRALGVSFALDDFGTGYSSLTYLKRLPANLLKIDQSFVRDMLDDPDDLAIVKGVIGLATAFRRKIIAEGVETVAHGSRLLSLGCDLAQGHGIARPMPAAALPGWAAAWRPDAAWTAVADLPAK
jgi:diguanylate cyclase (GGDEF)-like protein/PAS domain S-box-containing protein